MIFGLPAIGFLAFCALEWRWRNPSRASRLMAALTVLPVGLLFVAVLPTVVLVVESSAVLGALKVASLL